MANLGYLESLLGGVEPKSLRQQLLNVIRALVPRLRHGVIANQTKSENFQAYYLDSTTDSSTGELAIEHGMGVTPYAAIPCVPLDSSGARFIALEISRVADSRRIYVKAPAGSTNQRFTLLLE